ncbi:MAG: thioredoxin-dependent thiol peroxidase [Flavobacteriales bacterium]|nr:thioredoxin-dependent thiol peroxidase [Flavobacteriales bacterium]
MNKPIIGRQAPDFSGVDQHGRTISLQDLKGKKVVLFFYPKDDTPGCTAEACDLRDNEQALAAQGYRVIGVSPDDGASHRKFIEKFDLPFDLIADTDLNIIKAYGVWGLKKFMGREYEGVLRTTFLLDEKGVVQEIIDKVKTKEHASQILATTNQHG